MQLCLGAKTQRQVSAVSLGSLVDGRIWRLTAVRLTAVRLRLTAVRLTAVRLRLTAVRLTAVS